MDRSVDLNKYLPPVIRDTEEFREICNTENPEFSLLWEKAYSCADEQYIESMSIAGVQRMEKTLGIVPYDTDTLADRRFRLKTYSNSDLPYTRRSLERMLSALCGSDYTLTITGYTITIKVGLGVRKQYAEVQKLMDRVIPANMKLNLQLLYNTHQQLGAYTHQQLGAYTHQQLREEVFEQAAT